MVKNIQLFIELRGLCPLNTVTFILTKGTCFGYTTVSGEPSPAMWVSAQLSQFGEGLGLFMAS